MAHKDGLASSSESTATAPTVRARRSDRWHVAVSLESWAVSVEDYGNICGWMPPLAASYVRLLCSGEVQQRIDARVNRQEFRLLSTTAAVDTDPVMKSPSPSPDPTHIEVAASGASRRLTTSNLHVTLEPDVVVKRCRGCGDSDCRGDRQCRAFGVVCRSCGLKGHFWRQCPTLTPKGSAVTSSAVTVGSVDTLASLPVIVVCGNLRARCSTMAVADTGAQVSMAGRTLLNNLGILQHQLQPAPVAVNHVAGGGVRLLGSLICQLVQGPRQEHYGVHNAYPAHFNRCPCMVWFGQPSGTIPGSGPIMEPFRELLKKPVAKSVYWDEQLQAIFSSAKIPLDSWLLQGYATMTSHVQRPHSLTTVARVLDFLSCNSTASVYLRSHRCAAQAGGN
ncbi:hypothetical protein C7M84_015928 [Penaeus vannamei]|uniref:CCHC-type domain-containing protein n=1 Tax=Penaeus vannamei TaxID=6689 RepID=A0A423SPD6_PENVA|nr:hypothetical protein C7M84_015928 [Penaeus vannamei]